MTQKTNAYTNTPSLAGLLILLSMLISWPALGAPLPAATPSRAKIDKAVMAERVRQEFLLTWNAYKQYAWGHDELRPLSKGYHDWYGTSLCMTQLDALDALTLMGLKDEADKTREYLVKNLSFDKDIEVKNFEIVIRMLGGLLSNFQMSGDTSLLKLADDLGNRLLPVFNSPTGMPYMYINLKTGAVRGVVTNPAEIGTLMIEFGTLGKLTGKPAYYDKAKRAVVELYNRRSPVGLVGSTINVETGLWVDSTSHISGGIDSYYEYLLKSARLFDDEDFEKMWLESIKAVNKYLADDRDSALWYASANMFTGQRIATHYGALDAFFPAVLALSGDLRRAARLQESSYKMWTTFGIEPEELDYTTMTVTYGGYPLRPEIIESAYYLYFFTKDAKYLAMGQTFLDSLVRYCRVDAGYAALKDVRTKEKKDEMESFFLAETLKYLYLLFAPPETLDLSKVVFNTEAHPIQKTWH
jgi:ER degradation enhancer, mannosidase alpha-like 2